MGKPQGRIAVLAGTNGAGKSSILGAFLQSKGGTYYNPDTVAKKLRTENTGLSQQEANSLAWKKGFDLLSNAITRNVDFTFETTLGGETMSELLYQAARSGVRVTIWYVGLNNPEQHIERVAQRVSQGGHDIPEERIRYRFDASRNNLIALLPYLHELILFDNSVTIEQGKGESVRPKQIMVLKEKKLISLKPPKLIPNWAKAIVSAALKLQA